MESEVCKPIDKLTLEDIQRHPIWEFTTDEEEIEGRDETWVRPVSGSLVPPDRCGLSVSAEFSLANGTIHHGFVQIDALDGQVTLDPGVILSTGAYLWIPTIAPEHLSEFLRQLGLAASEVFPMHYRLLVRIQGERELRSGKVELPTA